MNVSFPFGPPPEIPDMFSFFEKSYTLYPEFKILTTSLLINSTFLCLLTSAISSSFLTENQLLLEAMKQCDLSPSPLQPPLHISNNHLSFRSYSFFSFLIGFLILVALITIAIAVLIPLFFILRKTVGNHHRLGLSRYLAKMDSQS